jgi:very-short-patch-repair endonuclease
MFSETITRLLEMSPAGLTSQQLLWHLRRSGLRLGADEIVQALAVLTDTGVARLVPGGRFRLTQFERPSDPSFAPPNRDQVSPAGETLRAVPAVPARRPDQRAEDLPEQEPADAQAARADRDWRDLLSYYAATQRLDPRGSVNERIDRHARSWQLFRAPGSWWEADELHFADHELPPEFREALSRRQDAACSLGYPVALFDDGGITGVMPALLLPASCRLDGQELTVRFTARTPSLNPKWLDAVARRLPGWRNESLAETLFPEGEAEGLVDVVQRLGNAVATLGGRGLRPADLDRSLDPAGEGLHNAAALFLPSETRFTQGAERELELIRQWTDETMRATALWPLLRVPGVDVSSLPAPTFVPAGPLPLTDRQYDAAAGALHGPLALIQGPPGTGKSEVILALLSSIVLQGGSALLVSKNHRALDEVEERLKPLIGDAPLLTRARDSDGGRDTDFLEALAALAGGETRGGDGAVDSTASVVARARKVFDARRHICRIEALHVALSAAVDMREQWDAALPSGVTPDRRTGWWARLGRWLRRRQPGRADMPGSRAELDERIASLQRQLGELTRGETAPTEPDPQEVANAAKDSLRRLAARIVLPTATERSELDEILSHLRFENRAKPSRMTPNQARQVLRHRPVWAVSALSAAARIPLLPALFDVVIFDEASQCDIASALPLFARARTAVVVGDPMQLRFVPQLSLHQERALMDAAGLGPTGRHLIAQSTNSLFEFTKRRDVAHRHFLADQFRSDPEIVAYLNAAFYEGQLIAAQDSRRARWPDGYRPGLDWQDVRGRAGREDGGNVNHDEADAIVQLLTGMIRERGFTGSIAVLSPFNAQVGLLQRRIRATLTEAEMHDVRVSTIDRAQGSEADVVLFSTVIAAGVHPGAMTFYERERRRLNVAISRARSLCIVVGDRAFARASRVASLAFLAEAAERRPRRREEFDSEWERRLYAALKRRGLEPIPQYPVGSRSLDLALEPEGRKLDVEVDGRRWHTDSDGNRKLADRLRDQELIARGWKVRRFWVHELAADMEKCVGIVERDLGRV